MKELIEHWTVRLKFLKQLQDKASSQVERSMIMVRISELQACIEELSRVSQLPLIELDAEGQERVARIQLKRKARDEGR